jgi:uncharacterized protein (DUF2141 family)
MILARTTRLQTAPRSGKSMRGSNPAGIRLPWLLLAVLAGATSASKADPLPGSSVLQLTVTGFPNGEGLAHIALVAGRETYEDEAAAPSFAARLPIVDKQVTWRVELLAPGEYAVRVFHDANGNNELDKSRRGVPKEHFGFSNDPPAKRRPASWDEAMFRLDPGLTRIEIKLHAPPKRSDL